MSTAADTTPADTTPAADATSPVTSPETAPPAAAPEAPPRAAPDVVDVEALLAPIPGENPSGTYLKYDAVYDRITDSRREEEDLAQGEWKRDIKVADWDTVEELSVGALRERTKDLQICAWMTEALVKNHGFPGLRDGLRVMRGLLERFWETVYPEIDRDMDNWEEGDPLPEGDITARANAVAWMDRQAALAVRQVPITGSKLGHDYSFQDFEDSKQFNIPEKIVEAETSSDELARISGLKAQAEEEGKITSDVWLKAKATTPRAFYEKLMLLVGECWTEYEALDRAMDETFKRETPGLGALKKTLDEIRSAVDKLVKEKRILEPDPSDAAADGEAGGVEGQGGVGGGFAGSGQVRSRQEALQKLSDVADFFRRTEPHSPVSYLVQRAVKWGNMPLDAWLEDVVKDGGVLGQLREMLGIRPGDVEQG